MTVLLGKKPQLSSLALRSVAARARILISYKFLLIVWYLEYKQACGIYKASSEEWSKKAGELKALESHWSKVHLVIVRDVLRSTTALCWDPVSIFCSYVENKCSESSRKDVMKATNCSDWCGN